MHTDDNEKSETIHDGRNRNTKSTQKNAQIKETYKYLEILEADNIKQIEIKEK